MSAVGGLVLILLLLLILVFVLWVSSRSKAWSVYQLGYGRGSRYYGISSNPRRREGQHRGSKSFHRLEVVAGPFKSRREAEEIESAAIEQYAVRRGRPPYYNRRKTRW